MPGGDVTVTATFKSSALATFSIDKSEYSVADNRINFTFNIDESTPNGKFYLYVDGEACYNTPTNHYGFTYSGSALTRKNIFFANLPEPYAAGA